MKTDRTDPLAPRKAALWLLGSVIHEKRLLSDLTAMDEFAGHPPAVKAASQRLAGQTLRHRHRADAMLKPFVSRPISPDIRLILQLAVTELLANESAPHGVVNAAVNLARHRQKRAAGLVNAVLRRVTEADRSPWDSADAPRLPNWIRGRLGSAYGNARVSRMETAHGIAAPLDLTVRDQKETERWAEALEAEILPTGSLRIARSVQVSALPGFTEGAWWVQDAAAAIPARLLEVKPGQRVLDLCAAPGGKTMQLAAAGAQVTALDISEARLARVRENLERTQLSADLITADALSWKPDETFDGILLDAPCTATGTIRRHPDLPFAKDGSGLKELLTLQAALLDKAITWLRPGGRLVYCTCSLLTEEGEQQISAARERHPDLTLVSAATGNFPQDWHGPNGELRLTPDLWPEKGGMDGFFVAVLQSATTHLP
ncbi:MAG: transcription antitermination factor NusB [Pseudomonadota bacterium]